MRKLSFAVVFLCVCMGGWGVILVAPAWGAETLTVTQDHLELRSEPRVADETFLSTVRKGAAVQWTGQTSGDWFEVQAPNGQTGWVRKSGISAPKAAVKPTPTPKPAATERPAGTRSVTATTAVSTLEKKVKDLEKANSQYKTQLEEKEKRVSELSKDIAILEEKISTLSSEQPSQDRAALADLQQRIDTLNATALLKNQELTVAQDQLAQLQTTLSREYPVSPWISYGANGLLLLGVCALGLLYIRRKKQVNEQTTPLETLPPKPSFEPLRPSAPESVIITTPKQNAKAGDGQKKIISAVETPSTISHQVDIIEESAGEEVAGEDFVAPDIIEELNELEKVEDIEDVEGDEVLDDVEEISAVETVEIDAVEEIETIEEEEEETIELVDDLAPEDIETVEEIAEVEDLIEELESPAPEDIEVELEVELIEDDLPEMETSPQDSSELEMLYSELEELESYLEEGAMIYSARPEITPAEQASTPVEVSGESFEMLVHPSTQIIAPEEEEYPEEEVIEEVSEEAVEVIEEVDEFEEREYSLGQNAIEEDVVEIVEEIEEIEEVEEPETNFETEAEPLFEPEEPPKFLEPSPILIEPEYEPAEVFPLPPQTSVQEVRYDIELVGVGKNKDQILGMLSKIQGLSQSPEELVNAIPSVIARGAKEQDARSFQTVMQKLGAEIRLIKK